MLAQNGVSPSPRGSRMPGIAQNSRIWPLWRNIPTKYRAFLAVTTPTLVE